MQNFNLFLFFAAFIITEGSMNRGPSFQQTKKSIKTASHHLMTKNYLESALVQEFFGLIRSQLQPEKNLILQALAIPAF
jgi:hypothetical protein